MYDNKSLVVAVVHRIGQSNFSDYKKCNNDEKKLQILIEDIVADLMNKNN